ncbi:hypothetical protein HK101_003559 [Irineochytrium annulatum]|nr:hypothetical protein HK101_003559 [Irineochytrium annulatum]
MNAFALGLFLMADKRELPFLCPLLIVGMFVVNMYTSLFIGAPADIRHHWVPNVVLVLLELAGMAVSAVIIILGAPAYRDLASKRTALFILISSCLGPMVFAVPTACFVVQYFHLSWESDFVYRLFRLFCSDGLGMITLLPFIISLFDVKTLAFKWRTRPGPCALGILCVVVICCIELFLPSLPQNLYNPDQLRFLSHSVDLPLVILTGFLMGNFGFTLSSLVMGISAVASTVYYNKGQPNSYQFNEEELLFDLLRLQVIMFVVELAAISFMVIQDQRDIALRASEDAGRHKSAFLAFLCHELRNPLHAIMNISVFLGETTLNAEQTQLCEAIRVSSGYMSELLNDVLDTAKLEAGKVKLNVSSVDVESLLDGVLAPVKGDVKTRSVTLKTDINLNGAILALDRVRLKQIINNLLSNAVKFTPENGEITLAAHVELCPHHTSRKLFVLRVSDTGIGIRREVLERLFKPYEQDMLLTAREYGGTGLGLSICKQLVDLMRGTIMVETEEGAGTTFTVRIPTHVTGDNGAVEKFEGDAAGAEGSEIGASRRGNSSDTRRAVGEGTGRSGHFLTVDGGSEDAGLNRDSGVRLGYAMHTFLMKERDADVALGKEEPDAIQEWNGSLAVRSSPTAEASEGPLGDLQPDYTVVNVAALHGHGWDDTVVDPHFRPVAPNCRKSSSTISELAYPNGPLPPTIDLTLPDPLSNSACSSSPPATQSPPTTAAATAEPAAARPPPTSPRPRVLLVDDSTINRRILGRLMQSLGAREVDECTNGLEAVERIGALSLPLDPGSGGRSELDYDVIFMDIQMPVMLGTEATRKLRRMGCTTPIIAVTANSVQDGGRDLCAEYGFTAVAPKPFMKKDAEAIFREFVWSRCGDENPG